MEYDRRLDGDANNRGWLSAAERNGWKSSCEARHAVHTVLAFRWGPSG